MTRWQGTPAARQPFMILPTARAARGTPAAAATSPYVATRPGGNRRTAANTRMWKSGDLEIWKSPFDSDYKISKFPNCPRRRLFLQRRRQDLPVHSFEPDTDD